MDLPHRKSTFSQLLLIPPEVHLQIYNHLFASIRLTHGKRIFSGISSKLIKPAPNSFEIQRSCRLIRREIGDSWLSQVLFDFEHVDNLLDKLCSVSRSAVEQTRRVRVRSHPLMLTPQGENIDIHFRLVPGLCLDTLTVINTSRPENAYQVLDGLIKFSDGWKELHYITGEL